MAFTAYPTVVTGDFITAALWNTYVRDNGDDLDRRTTMTSAIVSAAGTTTSTSYVLATTNPGPAVNTVIGSTRKALVGLYGNLEHTAVDGVTLLSFEISGGTTRAASDDLSVAFTSPTAGGGVRMGVVLPLGTADLVAAGSTTFTEMIRVGGTAGTGTVRDRRLSVNPLGS